MKYTLDFSTLPDGTIRSVITNQDNFTHTALETKPQSETSGRRIGQVKSHFEALSNLLGGQEFPRETTRWKAVATESGMRYEADGYFA